MRYIPDPNPDEVAGAQLAVYGEIEQREIANPSSDLQADTDGPDLVSFQRRLLAGYLAPAQLVTFRSVRDSSLDE